MKLLDSLTIPRGLDTRSIEIWQGDLTEMEPAEAVDILVFAAFPGSYAPVPGTLIGALDKKGVSVERLSKNKQNDLCQVCSCWLSEKIQVREPGIHFDQILCFEPFLLGSPTQVVGDIFRSLIPFVMGNSHPIQVAMPLVSTGNAVAVVADMTEALFTAAVRWLENGLPLKRLKIVEKSPTKAAEIKGAFAILKKHYQRAPYRKLNHPNYDVFLSYSHANANEADILVAELKRLKPEIKIFLDRRDLDPEVVWQTKLYRSLAGARKIVTLYSPNYLVSKACQEEYNFARLLDCQTAENTLFPMLLYPTQLMPHMAKWPYLDCLAADREKMNAACQRLVQELED
jgi:hypothetical protein